MGVVEGEIAASPSWEEDAGTDWDRLERVLSDLAQADLASKVQLLRTLSSFLSSVAATMSFSAEHHSVYAKVGPSQVCLGHNEVLQLQELIVRELKDQTCFLSRPSNKQMDKSAHDVKYTQILNLEVTSQTVRCCIRILPLVDCFDNLASLTCRKVLDGILQELCSPAKLFNLLGLTAPHGMDSGRSCQTLHGDNSGTWFELTDPHDSTSSQKASCESCMGNSLAMDIRHQRELICAILEVYVDELLLRPDLIARLLSSRENVHWSLGQEQVTCSVRHTEASLEAAFVHVLLSLHSLSKPQASYRARGKGLPVCNLSLPAGLILLERFSGEEVPPVYIAQVVRLLAGILCDTTPLDFGQRNLLTRTTKQNVSRSFEAGGVDWSYCSQERLPKCDLKDACLYINVLHSETTLSFASSVLENAIVLYVRFFLASDTCADRTGSSLHQKLQTSALKSCLSKHTPLFDILCKSLRLNAPDIFSQSGGMGVEQRSLCRGDCPCCVSEILDARGDFFPDGSGHSRHTGELWHFGAGAGIHHVGRRTGMVFKNQEAGEVSVLMAALLQLMSCALECISREVCKLTWLPHVFGDQFLDGQAVLAADSHEAEFDKILYCVGLYLCLFIPSATTLPSKYEYEEPQCGRAEEVKLESVHGHKPLISLVGRAIIHFANILRGEVQIGVPDGVLKEYFHLLESMVALLLTLDERNRGRHHTPECGLGSSCMLPCNVCRTSLEAFGYAKYRRCDGHEDGVQQLSEGSPTSLFLEEMVLSLQGILQDLSEQQRSMPEFLLFFILKQVSKGDGLSLVALVFRSCLHSHLDIQQMIMHSAEVFRSGGLVTQVLHLALSEPTRSYSLLTFIVYMVDILQDLLPITASLSLSEITEPISWYENIAYSLTMASQLAVCEQSIFARNGREPFLSLISKMGAGIDRLLTEGTAAAHWLSDLSKTLSESAWQNLTGVWEDVPTRKMAGENSFQVEQSKAGNFATCNSFLGQVDMLRKAVEDLASSGESSIGSALTPLLEKGRTFSAALLDLLSDRRMPGSQWGLYLSPHSRNYWSGSELDSYLQVILTDMGPGCACGDCQQPNLDQDVVLEDVVQGTTHDHGRTPATNERGSTGHQRCEAHIGSSAEKLDQDIVLGDMVQEETLDHRRTPATNERGSTGHQRCEAHMDSSAKKLDQDVVLGDMVQEETHDHGRTPATNERGSSGHQRCEAHIDSSAEKLDRDVVFGDMVQEGTHDHGRTPATNERSSTGHQRCETPIDSSAEKLEQVNKFSDEQQEELGRKNKVDNNPILSGAEVPVASIMVRAEKRQTRSATLLMAQKLEMKKNEVILEKPCSSTTSAIIKRLLLQKHSPSRRKVANSSQECDKRPAGVGELTPLMEETSGQERAHSGFVNDASGPAPSVTHSYVDSLSKQDSSKDNFDDLKDFIVPKRGRDYSVWLARRHKVRRRSYSKSFFRRLHEKKELLRQLDIT